MYESYLVVEARVDVSSVLEYCDLVCSCCMPGVREPRRWLPVVLLNDTDLRQADVSTHTQHS